MTKSYNGIGNQLVIILYTVGKFGEGLTVSKIGYRPTLVELSPIAPGDSPLSPGTLKCNLLHSHEPVRVWSPMMLLGNTFQAAVA